METGPMFEGAIDNIDLGGNPNAVTPDFATSELAQASAAQSCLVRLRIEELDK